MEITFLSQLATALVVALVPVVISAIGYLVRTLIGYVKAKTNAEQFRILSDLAAQAVQAVEQTLKTRPATEKFDAAKAVVTGALLKKGIVLDELQIAAAIEAAVYIEKGIGIAAPTAAPSLVDALPDVTAPAVGSETGAAQ